MTGAYRTIWFPHCSLDGIAQRWIRPVLDITVVGLVLVELYQSPTTIDGSASQKRQLYSRASFGWL